MADAYQLNLFGDFTSFDKDKNLTNEVENAQSMGENGQGSLEEVSSELLPETGTGRDSGEGTPGSGRESKGHDGGSYGERSSEERSPGDSTPTVHNSTAERKTGLILYHGTKSGNIIEKFNLDLANYGASGNIYSKVTPGIYLTTNFTAACYYSRKAGQLYSLRDLENPQYLDNAWEKLFGEKDGNIVTAKLPDDIKIKEIDFYPDDKEILKIKNDRFDGINFPDERLKYIEDYPAEVLPTGKDVSDSRTIFIFDPDKIQVLENSEIPLKVDKEKPPTLPRSPGVLRNGHTDDRGNYHITSDDLIGKGGKVSKFDANIEAIRILKLLEEQKRNATPEEQSKLVLYTGWGGLSEVFKQYPIGLWADRKKVLSNLLTESEFRSASRSTMNSFYTTPEITERIWDAVVRMGYSGGPTLEPATGVGHFFGKRPSNLPIEMHGIELDSISCRIAQQLYQSADIKITGYEDIKMPENRYNLIISNVPFGDIKPYEETKNQTPGLTNRYSIHDFYFLKSLHGLKEGGLVAFITSRYTLDKNDNEIREKIAEKADFLGAIRLPNNSFSEIANTEVVTDIVFLQKRLPDVEMSELTKKFISTETIALPCSDGQLRDVQINSYFVNHPEMIMGTHDLSGTMYQGNEYTVNLSQEKDLKLLLSEAIKKLPENVMSIIVDEKTHELDTSSSKPLSHLDTDNLPLGSFVVGLDTRLYQKDVETSEVTLCSLYENEAENKNEIIRIMQMSKIRDCVKDAFSHYYSGQQLEVNRDLSRLNSLYDSFIKEHGFLNSRKNIFSFCDDPDSSLLQSLEIWDLKTKTATKAEIFDGISFVRKEPVTSVDSPIDAMILSLSRYGNFNLSYMESLTGIEKDQLIDKLISSGHVYQDAYEFITNNRVAYLTADEYLSGNIREKLHYAQLASENDPSIFLRNVSSLQNVMPKDIEPRDISLRINSPIVGDRHVRNFVRNLLSTSRVDVIHIPITGKWEIKCVSHSPLNTETYGTKRMSAVEILNCIMNGKPIKVYDKVEDDKLILNQEETSAAELKADQIQNAFNQWLWKDEERTADISTRYNEVYNSHIERNFIHPERMRDPDAQIRFHGCNFPFAMRPNQADAVWRILQQNNSMLAHTVGAGKTLEMACAAMELRRLGLRNKPMIVCPDHMIGQWAAEFRSAYPAAKLLIADDQNWDKENRRTFVNKIATGDWDAVIIRAESFKMIPMSLEYQKEFYEKKIEEYQDVLAATDYLNKRTRSVKDLEKAIEKYKDKIKELSDMDKDEGVLPFDRLGVDHIFIDEADLYKNLEYYTQLQNVRGLGTPKGSERSLDMLMKIRHIQSIDGGVTFATGTPISNTLVETYTMQRFLQPEVLKANGLEAFDEWARQYAESVTQMELNNTGTGYTPVTRFSKIVNVPELVGSLRQTWDIQTAHNLEQSGILVPGINLPRMKIINESAPSTPLLKSYLKYLEQREKDLKGKPEKGSDNVLSIMTDGRKAAIDMRLINPHFPDDPDSKLNLAVKVINDVYTRYKAEGFTCAVFFDKSRSYDPSDPSKVLFDGVNEIKSKLIAFGVKREEIGDVRDCKSFDERRALFEKVNDGRVRVIFGSTDSMGAGTNFQTCLKAIVHVDAPWRPRDIEQQNGRGYRPGNKTGELEVYNLVTKGSLDTGLWNVLETKANSIRQVMDGSDKSTRQIEENYYGSVKELSIDNALMKEAMELDHSLRKLKSQQRSHVNEVAHAHRMMQTIPSEIEKEELYIENVLQDIEKRHPEAKGDDFKMILGNNTFTDRKEAGTSILSETKTLFLKAKSKGENIEKNIGSYSGMNLILRSTLYDPYCIGRLNACGNNFRYSADVRQDSDPVGLCRSLHNQIYKGMEKLLEQSKEIVTTKKSNLEEFSRLSKAAFPKQNELQSKEKRYSEVMEQLKKENETKAKENEIHNNIPWASLRGMTPDQIKDSVREFYKSSEIEKIEPVSESRIETCFELQKSIREKYSINLPASILSMIETSSSSGKMDVYSAYTVVSDTIDKTKSNCFSWKEYDSGGIYVAYAKDPSSTSIGDVIVRKSKDEAGFRFDAYRIQDSKTSKYLGSEKEFSALQNRIESYIVCHAVKDKLSEVISLANKFEKPIEKISYNTGLDL